MIDITTIQTFAVAPALETLQKTTTNLITDNNKLKTMLIGLAIGGGALITYLLIKKYYENKSRVEDETSKY